MTLNGTQTHMSIVLLCRFEYHTWAKSVDSDAPSSGFCMWADSELLDARPLLSVRRADCGGGGSGDATGGAAVDE